MEPVFADFSTTPARLSNAVVGYHRCGVAPSHLAVGSDGYVKIDFTTDGREEIGEAVLTVTTLGTGVPLDVLLNGKAVAEGLVFPGADGDGLARGGQDEAGDRVVSLPGELLTPGDNLLEIRSPAGEPGLLRLTAVTVDPVQDRGRARRAMAARASTRSVFAFDTERRPAGSSVWQAASRLLFHLDRGERAVPAQLSWRGTDGAETAIALREDLSGFHGHHRAADGAIGELRGVLADRWAYPEGIADVPPYRFSTEEGRDGEWRPSGELRVLLDDGRGAGVERVTWTDRRGNAASITLTAAVAAAATDGRTAGGGPAPVPAPGELSDITDTVTDVEASDEFAAGGEVARNLLRKSRTKWLVHDDTAELDFTLEHPAAVASYSLTSANDAPDRDPRDWRLQGSHDGGTWTTLDTRTGERFGRRFETRDFSFANSVPYRRYRLLITDNAGGDEIQLSRVQFLAGAGRAPAATAADFIGYYAPAGGTPTGYRGTTVPVPGSDAYGDGEPREKLLAADLTDTAQDLDSAARLLGKLAEYLRTP
ncbi:discoidin domain-containing protein [Streptomyces liangshanensis]|uniref:Discoidin domain-containing protein n=1 Tax=Streptomyces liangshanensis TaxID=2717324 RepID=A0A6G9GZY9_9ACTN|nr:discoidin domain-containing protein [Streptomyces liangshanensis]QIQ03636.1 discoidin domain-containing protein [Streptomyces liangshanensis]